MENHNEVLLKVDHLCQYFRMGRKDMKAVDDVSFEIKKGEAFGLVGESGCGKTTTGRSIIKLYDITSGNIYFKGHRIGAGIRSYKDAIKKAKADFAAKAISEVDYKAIVAQNRALIRDAKADRTSVDKQYAATLIAALNKEYECPGLSYQDPSVCPYHKDEDIFFRTVQAAFEQRRKTLPNALSAGFSDLTKEQISQAIADCGHEPNIRGERLDIAQFVALSDALGRYL